MKLFLNNIFKGLLVSLLVITLGGFLYINISKPKEIDTKLKLISSSVINQIVTESKKEEDTENNEDKTLVEEKEEVKETSEEVEVKEVVKDKIEESKEKETDKKVEEVKPKEETTNATSKEPEKPNTDSSQNTNPNNSQSEVTNQAPAKPSNPYAPNLEVASTMPVLDTYYGNITAYGPDCVGCGGMVAHGENVTNGNIYYNDKTFGNIRIVAGDRSLGFGTIVRISGLRNTPEPILAIMLDTGGAIGFESYKNAYFDLLYVSEAQAYSFGKQKATFEILRYGF